MCTQPKVFRLVGVGLAIGLTLAACKKAQQPARVDPHSPEAALQTIRVQGGWLNDAVQRKDFQFIHDNMYYLQTLTKALQSKLDAGEKERLGSIFDELAKVTNELDHSAGRRHEEATQAGMQKLQEILKDLETQFNARKKPAPTPGVGTWPLPRADRVFG